MHGDEYQSDIGNAGKPTENNNIVKMGNMKYELKPYVYYSCRYKNFGTNPKNDVVITYSLDSYISIRGMLGDDYIDISGYLLSSVEDPNIANQMKYRDMTIENESLRETVIVNGSPTEPYYKKVNGVKYYQDQPNQPIYYISNGTQYIHDTSGESIDIQNNTSAIEYYKNAEALKKEIKDTELISIKASDAVDEKGDSLAEIYGDYKIFEELEVDDLSKTQIEDDDSNFNSHRLDVIKYSIERNLSIVINNFNRISGDGIITDFQLPKLKDSEWDLLTQNIGMISFLQGLNIGGKLYNGYSIVINTKNEEFVSEESIYVETNDHMYHKVRDTDLNNSNVEQAYYNIDFERKTGYTVDRVPQYYYPREGLLGCYNCIVTQKNVQYSKYDLNNDATKKQNIAEFLGVNRDNNNNSNELAKIYYTALARERQGLYRARNLDT